MPVSLICLGNPLLDIQIPNSEKLLEKYNLKSDDAILVEEAQMGIYEDALKSEGVFFCAGGASQNTARGAQTLLPAGSVAYVGSVGRDVYSEKQLEANKKAGVTTHYMFQDDIPTGKCAVLLSGVHRSLVTDLAAANHYQVSHLEQPENWALVESAKVSYVEGYHLTVCVPAILALAKHAAEKNKVFAMNISAPFLPTFFKEQFDTVAPYWDYLIGNESEALAYAESHDLKTTDITEIAKHLALLPKENKQRSRTVLITQGLEPTIVALADNVNNTVEVKTFDVPKLPQEKIVDTNGAGDAFAAGFISGVVEGDSLDESIHRGQWLAREGIQLNGPSYPEPPYPLAYPKKA